ncbi:transmembrane protein 232 [Ambystoma mexicanum]|uniref:transmembrane protein 232 n=1 Tax=Ambystoma mexicanum TaxID=8296 RepID=UPI0037E82592
MPIIKVPTEHIFGILSQSQHQALQEKHFTKTAESPCAPLRKLPEVTDEFINQFNNATEKEEQEHFLDQAEKLLIRCKRRAGCSSLGTGGYVDLPRAWTELILLAQCKGKIQEDALDTLLVSLDHAPMEPEHFPVLFFLAESVLYRICCDAVQKPYLYSSEVKLSKLGFLTLLRLYWLHLSGQLSCHEEYTQRLYTYLQAIPACEESYQPYPNVLAALHVMLRAGEIICGAGETWNKDLAHKESLEKEENSLGMPCLSSSDSVATKPEASVPEMSCLLWHSLLAWFSVRNDCSQLPDVLQHLSDFKEELLNKNWLESALTLFVLGEAAKINVACLKVLLDLLRVVLPSSSFLQMQDEGCQQDLSSWPWELIYIYSSVLADICVNANTAEMRKYALVGFPEDGESAKCTDEVQDTSLCGLLRHNAPSSNKPDAFFWIIRYSAVYNLVKVCNDLHGDVNREGLRNAAWKALYKHQTEEEDPRVLEAVKVAEAEINGPANPFVSSSPKTPSTPCSSQHVAWRLTTALSLLFLPPVVPPIHLPKKYVPRQPPRKHPVERKDSVEKRVLPVSQLSIRKPAEATNTSMDYISRTRVDLIQIIKAQWSKHLDKQIEEEEDLCQKALLEKEKKEQERFLNIMKQREEKLKKKTKPYELSSVPHQETNGGPATS